MTALLRFTIDHFLLLPIGGLLALAWANSSPESYFTIAHRLAFPVNEVGMALFFALVTQDVIEELMPGGALHSWRRWGLPMVAGLGGVLGAALVYTALVDHWFHQEVLHPGWPVAGAVDLAFAYFVVRTIFGRHPAIPFVLLLAITADAATMLFVASRQMFVEVRPGGTALMTTALAIAIGLRHWHVRSFWPYLMACGPLSWWALALDGFHPAFALVPIVPFFVHAPRTLDIFGDPPHGRHDSPQHFEHVMKYPIQAVLFFFAFANAGALLNDYGDGTWALLAAALIGKPVGICLAIVVAVAAGLHLPARLRWTDVPTLALATTGVFTFGLFFATAVFPIGPVLAELKLGAVATGIGVPIAFAAAWFLGAGRFNPRHSAHSHLHHQPHPHHPRGHVHGRHGGGVMAQPTRLITFVLTLSLGLPALAVAQNPPRSDDVIADRIAERLYDRDIRTVMIFVDRGIVTLRGTVATLWAKQMALEQAARVNDVVAVISEITVPRGESDDTLASTIAAQLQRYVFFTIFDDADVEVNNGVATLTGRVTMPYKGEALADLAAHVAGVQEVRNQIKTLPVSQFDDQLRYAVARQIYGDDLFVRYATHVNPPIHIVVEHGTVTLRGVVGSELERRKAESLARGTRWVLSVVNKLRVEDESN